MSDEPIDPVPGQRAALDQLAMEAPMVAVATRTLFLAYTGEGFTDEQALMLTIATFKGAGS